MEFALSTIVILAAPVGLIYSWFFYLTRMRREPAGWRSRVTLLALGIISVVCVLWPVMAMRMPKADWGTGLGVAYQAGWVEAWHPPIFRTLGVALVLSLFARPRLIGPLVVACIGTAMFWLVSTMP